MIIYGHRAVHLKTIQPNHLVCPNCGSKGTIQLSVYRRHAHVFWIPFFPIGKKGISQCQHCKHVMEVKEMPEDVRRAYNELKSESRGPIWQFTGLFLLALLFPLGAWFSSQEKKTERSYIQSPQVGDVYEYKIESNRYSTFKVMELKQDSLVVVHNEYETDKASGTNDINKEENYDKGEWYSIPKSSIREMYEKGEIFDVNR